MFKPDMKEKSLSPMDKKAKMSVLEEMKKQAMGMMGDNLKGVKKVSVASNSPEGLKEGLHKAQEIVEGDPEAPTNMDMQEGRRYEDMPSDLDSKIEEYQKLSPDEIDAHIQALTALKSKMGSEQPE